MTSYQKRILGDATKIALNYIIQICYVKYFRKICNIIILPNYAESESFQLSTVSKLFPSLRYPPSINVASLKELI